MVPKSLAHFLLALIRAPAAADLERWALAVLSAPTLAAVFAAG